MKDINYNDEVKNLVQDNLSSFQVSDYKDSNINEFNSLVKKGESALKLNYLSNALNFFLEAWKLVPNNASINYKIGDLYNRMEYQNGTSCIEYYRRANESSIHFTDQYHKLGVALILHDKNNKEVIDIFIECITRYDEEIEKDNQNYKLYLYKGIVYYFTRDFDEALSFLNMAAKYCNIKDDEIYFYMALVYTSLSMDNEAIDKYKKCLEINKKNIFALYKLSLLYHKNNKIEEALNCLDIAINIDNNFADAFNIKGQILLELNRKDEAEKYLESAKKLSYCRNDKLPSYSNYLLSKESLSNTNDLIKTNKINEEKKLNSNNTNTYSNLKSMLSKVIIKEKDEFEKSKFEFENIQKNEYNDVRSHDVDEVIQSKYESIEKDKYNDESEHMVDVVIQHNNKNNNENTDRSNEDSSDIVICHEEDFDNELFKTKSKLMTQNARNKIDNLYKWV